MVGGKYTRSTLRKSLAVVPSPSPRKNECYCFSKSSSIVHQTCGLRLIPALNNSLKEGVGIVTLEEGGALAPRKDDSQ